MCTKANLNIGLFQIRGIKYRIPVCHVECCNWDRPDIDEMIDRLTQPIQTAVLTKALEVKVQDLTTELAGISEVLVKKQAVKKTG